MKIKFKKALLNIMVPTLSIGIIAPIVGTLSSCSGDKNQDKHYPTKTIKMDKIQRMEDINSETAPLCILNTDPYHLCKIVYWAPENTTVKAFYQVGDYDPTTNTIDWSANDWVLMNNDDPKRIQNLEYMHPIRFYAYNTDSTKLGSFNTHINTGDDTTNLEYRIIFTKLDGSAFERGKGVKLAGSVRSLLCTKEISSKYSETVEALEDLNENSKYAFSGLFAGDIASYEASGDICEINPKFLPFKTMAEGCYSRMFEFNTNLLVAPDLPASTLAARCYYKMFSKCTGLQNTPYLPAKKVVNGCYEEIFSECSNLNTVSLGYVGNFLTTVGESKEIDPFKSWLAKSGVSDAKLYYDGEDTEVSDNAIPSNFSVVSKKKTDPEWLNKNTKVIEIKNDHDISTTQTSKLTGSKTKFRAYNDSLVSDITNQIPTHESLVTGVSTYSYYKKDGTNDPEIIDLTTEGAKVSSLPSTMYVKYEKPKDKEDSTVTNIVAEGTTTVYLIKKATGSTLQYWDKAQNKYVTFSQGSTITLEEGDVLKLRGDIKSTSTSSYTNLVIKGNCKLTGTVMSFLSDDGTPATSLKDRNYAFYSLFEGSTGIKSVSADFLPSSAIALTQGCFQRMFFGCSGIVTPPKLPSTGLKTMCYAEMFSGCTKLSNLPGDITSYLPATASAPACYYKMFKGCTSLTKAPNINFTTTDKMTQLTKSDEYIGVCEEMFSGCTSLQSAEFTLNPLDIAPAAYCHMFYNCTSLTTAPKLNVRSMGDSNSTNQYKGSCAYMFQKCSGLTNGDVFVYTGTFGSAGAYSLRGMFIMSDDGKTRDTNAKLKRISTFKFKWSSNKSMVCADMYNGCGQLDVTTDKPSSGTYITVLDGTITMPSYGTLSANNGTSDSMFGRTKNLESVASIKNKKPTPAGTTKYYVIL